MWWDSPRSCQFCFFHQRPSSAVCSKTSLSTASKVDVQSSWRRKAESVGPKFLCDPSNSKLWPWNLGEFPGTLWKISDDKRKSSFCGKSSNQKAVVFYSKVLVYLEGILLNGGDGIFFKGLIWWFGARCFRCPKTTRCKASMGPTLKDPFPPNSEPIVSRKK